MKKAFVLVIALFLLVQCKNINHNPSSTNSHPIDKVTIDKTISQLIDLYHPTDADRLKSGVRQVALLWTAEDGNRDEFQSFCKDAWLNDSESRQMFFEKVSNNLELIKGYYNMLEIELKKPVHLSGPELTDADLIFGSFSPSAHLNEDLYQNKIAFKIVLNFPHYPLAEKKKNADKWTSLDWAYARLGDLFTDRVPARMLQEEARVLSAADNYISEYNIYMGHLIDDQNQRLFPEDMVLISHWGLRDELKSHYANPDELKHQEMIYQVMLHIINQDIPGEVINSPDYDWNPIGNTLYKEGNKLEASSVKDNRYQVLLDNFNVMQKMDAYYPNSPSYIIRKFDDEMEMSQEEVEKLFTEFISSPVIAKVGKFISQRLGRNLQPFDIWYDGFKSRSSIDETELDASVVAKYPSREAFSNDLPNILQKLDFSPDLASFICSKISVDPARGAGHAWGSEMKGDVSHLRTRIGENGMNYKGYNIAIHEFGHNVEQTISLYDVPYYILHGVPNTAFTEALAFIFQKRDLELLGIENQNPMVEHMNALDLVWSTYEIMGVSLVDMRVWKWMYSHPDCTASELKNAVIKTAKEVWNDYYAPVFGEKDSPILAIYSHMIDYPLYLSAYPIGHLIDFQIEKQIKDKSFADEVYRIYSQGRLTPQIWMKNAVGNEVSGEPMLEAAENAITAFSELGIIQ